MAVGQTRQDANSAPTSSHQPTQRGQQQEQETPQAYKDWQDLIDSLQRISTELSKEEENPRQDIIQLLAKEIKRATESRDQDSPPKRGQEQDQGHQLDRIETEIQALRQELNKTPPLAEKGPEKGQSPRSWANIAA
jgi:two-component sensor histidine kinase